MPDVTVTMTATDFRLARSFRKMVLRTTEIMGTVATQTKTIATGASEIANAKKDVFATWHAINATKLFEKTNMDLSVL